MQCPSCHASLPAGARFCPGCAEPASPDAFPAPATADPLRASLERALGGQYQILRQLGRGGMGAVYLARETSLDRLVAIKVLPPETADNAEMRERFRREARTAARLTHPNIVPLHAFGETEGTLYYVMGYVRGEPLAARLRRDKTLPAEDVRRILAEVADALDYAHRQGVVHRDIKPDNVLMDDDSGRALLADFGIAKARDAGATLTALGSVVGTPTYISPEQASGKTDIDGRSDLYSLGVMGYQMLSGRPPFSGDTPRDVLMQHLTQEPKPLAQVAASTPSDIVSAVTRCLAKEPERRWPDGKALREALGRAGSAEQLPEVLESVDGFGVWILVFLVLAVFVEWYRYGWRQELTPGGNFVARLLQAPLVVVPLGLLQRASEARAAGVAWRQILRVAFWQPAWWRSWYPRPLRRPGDLWDRLPAMVRRARAAQAGLMLYLLAMLADVMYLFSPLGMWQPRNRYSFEVEAFGLCLGVSIASVLTLVAQRRLHKLGLGSWDAARVLSTPTRAGSFWSSPHVAKVLTPPAPPRVGSDSRPPRSAHELLQGIVRAAQELTGGAREWGSRAVAASRSVLSRLEALDQEIARLGQRAAADEVDGVERRLAALGPEAADDGEQRQMRQLLSSQREMALRWATRKERKEAERVLLLGHLEAIWSELESLCSLGSGSTSASDRLRVLCAEAEVQAGDVTPSPADTAVAPLEDAPTLDVSKDQEPS